jgi:hypothetical protein
MIRLRILWIVLSISVRASPGLVAMFISSWA